MSDHAKNKEESTKKNQAKKDAQKPGFWEWLIHGKGSVSEPWPTVEEVLQDESVQKDIQEVKEAFDVYQKAQNKNSQNKES